MSIVKNKIDSYENIFVKKNYINNSKIESIHYNNLCNNIANVKIYSNSVDKSNSLYNCNEDIINLPNQYLISLKKVI